MKIDHLCMRVKVISGYFAVLVLSFLLYSLRPVNSIYYNSLPALMLIFPVAAGHRIKISFSIKDSLLGFLVSFIVLFPFYLVSGGDIRSITVPALLFQLLAVSFPEEFFFRGFVQDSLGRTARDVLLASLLFSFAHLPRAVFQGDWISLLSFFPSLIMGWLYMKTNNIVPGTIFHLLANLLYQTSAFHK